jgi:uncharacterized protein (DUF433 family)
VARNSERPQQLAEEHVGLHGQGFHQMAIVGCIRAQRHPRLVDRSLQNGGRPVDKRHIFGRDSHGLQHDTARDLLRKERAEANPTGIENQALNCHYRGVRYRALAYNQLNSGANPRIELELLIMSTAIRYPHLTIDDDGTARIEQSRYKVIHLAGEHYHYGWSAEEILRQHPDLRPEQVHAALTYFYDHHDRLVDEMLSIAQTAEAGRLNQKFSRAELIKRQSRRSP